MYTDLLRQIQNNELLKFKEIITKNNTDELNALKDKNTGHGLIHDAAKIGQRVNFISELIETGVLVDSNDKNGNTPLHYAINSLNFDEVVYLINNGADVNKLNNNGFSPLTLINYQINNLILEDELANKDKLEIARNILTVLGVFKGKVINVTSDNIMGQLIIETTDIDVAALVLKRSRSLTSSSDDSIIIEARKLEKTSNDGYRTDDGYLSASASPLIFSRSNKPCLSPILFDSSSSGEDLEVIDEIDKNENKRVYELLRKLIDSDDIKSFKFYLNRIANSNISLLNCYSEDTGASILQYAITCEKSEFAKSLIKTIGVNVDFQDKSGNTPLIYCIRNKQVDILLELVMACADPFKVKDYSKDDHLVCEIMSIAKKYHNLKMFNVDSLKSPKEKWSMFFGDEPLSSITKELEELMESTKGKLKLSA